MADQVDMPVRQAGKRKTVISHILDGVLALVKVYL